MDERMTKEVYLNILENYAVPTGEVHLSEKDSSGLFSRGQEFLESRALDTAAEKPLCWYRYVDDTFVVWPHGADALGFYKTSTPFIHESSSLWNWKEVNSFLFSTSCDQNVGDRAAWICEPHRTGIATSAPSAAGQRLRKSADKKGNATKQLETDHQRTPTVQRLVGDNIATLYQERYGPNRQDTRATQYKNDIQTHAAITSPATFGKGLRYPLTSTGVYRILCFCGLVYIGTTKRSIYTRLKEHKRNCRLDQTDKSAVAEHALQDGDHNIILPIPRFYQQFRITTPGYKETQ
ncbi:hypothetical protein Trydic_g10395 [Trypoxylus dichotomus]